MIEISHKNFLLFMFFNGPLIVRGELVTRDTSRSNCPARVAQFPHKSQPGRTKLEDDLRYGRRPVTAS